MTALLLAPAILSLLALAAHFLRRGDLVMTGLCLALVFVLAERYRLARRDPR
jgi:hypothetical protein